MKKVLMILSFVFIALTLLGALYVIITGGEASPGFAVIPLICSLVCNNIYRLISKKK